MEDEVEEEEAEEKEAEDVPALNWRMDPKSSFSDWAIYVTVRETGETTPYYVHKNIVGTGPRKSGFLVECFRCQDEEDSDDSDDDDEARENVAPMEVADTGATQDKIDPAKAQEAMSQMQLSSDDPMMVDTARPDATAAVTAPTRSTFVPPRNRKNTTEVMLHADAAQVVPLLLDYIYPDINFSMSTECNTITAAIQLHNTADFFQVEGIEGHIKNFLRHKLELCNLCEYVHATEGHDRFTLTYNAVATDIMADELARTCGEDHENYYKFFAHKVENFLVLMYGMLTGTDLTLQHQMDFFFEVQERQANASNNDGGDGDGDGGGDGDDDNDNNEEDY